MPRLRILYSHHQTDIVELLFDVRTEADCLSSVEWRNAGPKSSRKNVDAWFLRDSGKLPTPIDLGYVSSRLVAALACTT